MSFGLQQRARQRARAAGVLAERDACPDRQVRPEIEDLSAAEVVAIGAFDRFKRTPREADAFQKWARASENTKADFIAEAQAGLALAERLGKVVTR